MADFTKDFVVEDDAQLGAGATVSPRQDARLQQVLGKCMNAKKDVGDAVEDLDPHRIAQRQKQVDFGKNTLGYQNYVKLVPREARRKVGERPVDPETPDINLKCSKRCFDGLVRVWRRSLHKYDAMNLEAGGDAVDAVMFTNPEAPSRAAEAPSPSPSNPASTGQKRGYQDAFQGQGAVDNEASSLQFGSFGGAADKPFPSTFGAPSPSSTRAAGAGAGQGNGAQRRVTDSPHGRRPLDSIPNPQQHASTAQPPAAVSAKQPHHLHVVAEACSGEVPEHAISVPRQPSKPRVGLSVLDILGENSRGEFVDDGDGLDVVL